MKTEQYIFEWPVNHWKKKQGGEIKKIESNKNKSTNSQNIQAAAKAILRKFIAIKIR